MHSQNNQEGGRDNDKKIPSEFKILVNIPPFLLYL